MILILYHICYCFLYISDQNLKYLTLKRKGTFFKQGSTTKGILALPCPRYRASATSLGADSTQWQEHLRVGVAGSSAPYLRHQHGAGGSLPCTIRLSRS